MDDKERSRAMLREQLRICVEALVSEARAHGLVVTVEQVPLTPLAMGNYRTVVSVREGRK